MRRVDVALACVGLTVTAYILIATLTIVHNAYSPLPFEDSWREWQRYLVHRNYSAFLFSQHNEHRIVVPRLFFLIDRFVFHARNLFPLACSLAAQAATGVWLYRMSRRTGEVSPLSRLLLGCAICSALFSAQQFPNLVQGFQIATTMLYCAVCGSIVALLRAAERREERGRPGLWFAISCLSALVATYSSASGLLCWPLLLLLALWLRLPLRFRLTLAGCMILVASLYMWGYRTPAEHSSPLVELTRHPIGVLIRAGTFLGSPADAIYAVLGRLFGVHSPGVRIGLAAVCGVAGMAATLLAGALLWRRKERFTKGHAALVHVAFLVVLSAGMVGLGRATFPLASAMDARYRTHALVFWIAIGAFYWRLFERRLGVLTEGWLRVAAGAVILPVIVGFAVVQPSWMQFSKEYADTQREIEAAIVSDVFDEPVWTKSFPFSPYGQAIMAPVDYLRRNRLSVFTEAWTSWTGQPVDSLFTIDHVNVCTGSFDSAEPIPSPIKPGWRVSGWAWDKQRQSGAGTVILVDPSQRIAGVVRADVRGRWSGYVAGSEPKKLTAYLLEQDGHALCAIGSR